MRMSCNGCRVLRKGCNQNCSIRPCLQWIKSTESQANATVFLAKFYGRAGLLNLLNSGPDHLRPAVFRSLLYEACGRIVNPIYGSVGLLWAGNWPLCQAAVEAVLKGDPITQVSADAAAVAPAIKGYDIRHVVKDDNHNGTEESGASSGLHRAVKARAGFKRAGSGKSPKGGKMAALAEAVAEMAKAEAAVEVEAELGGSECSVSHDETTMESMLSEEAGEAAPVVREATPEAVVVAAPEKEAELDLRLSL